MLGFNKWFVIFLFLSLIIWYGTGNVTISIQLLIGYIIVRIVWRFFT